MDMEFRTYVALSMVMFLEYAIWGAWAPVLSARLLGPLKMSARQTSWIYSTLPIGCILSPLVAGQVADQWVNLEWILVAAHAAGAVLLFIAARTERFRPLLVIMLLYSLCFAATLPLVNAVLFAATSDVTTQANVFIWAPVAWALVGWSLTGWRMTRKTEGDGRDCLYLACGLSVLMALGCLFLAPNPPAGTGKVPVVEAMQMLGDGNFLIFLALSLVVFGLMQFYFLGTARFMQDRGLASKHVPGSMALAQVAQAIATWFLLGLFLETLGFKWTLVVGSACWVLMYLVYTVNAPRALIVAVQPLHGLAYVFFVIVGQIFAEAVAPEEIRSSMQALVFTATVGVGLFLGTQFAGVVMEASSREGEFQWRRVWLVPGALTLVGVLLLLAFFQNPPV